MSEWWTYTLSDFLMFSPRTYARLLAQANRDAWPSQPLLLMLGALGLLAARRWPARGAPLFTVALALAWVAVGGGFLMQRYAQVFTAAPWAAAAFGAQAALLSWWAWRLGRRAPAALARAPLVGAAVVLLGYPLLAPLTGRPLAEAEVAGLLPEPTALLTLCWLGAVAGDGRRWLMAAVPLLWCALASATLHLLQRPLAMLPLAAAALALLLPVLSGRRPRPGPSA